MMIDYRPMPDCSCRSAIVVVYCLFGSICCIVLGALAFGGWL